MSVIYRYTIARSPKLRGAHDLMLPEGAQILRVDVQHETHISVWAIVEPTNPMRQERFVIVYTGDAPPPNGTYVTTCLLDGGDLVLHIFRAT